MYTVILLVTALFSAGDVWAEFSEVCEDPSPTTNMPDVNECVSRTWYLYAGSTPCENCCMFRNMTLLQPTILSVTDTLQQNQNITVYNYIATMSSNSLVFLSEKEVPEISVMIDTDCRNYAAIYDTTNNYFQIFTNDKTQQEPFLNSLNGVRQCNMELYLYHPELSC